MNKLIVAAAGVCAALPVCAQSPQKVHPPVAQFWMDAATHSLSLPGVEEMEGDSPLAGMLGGAFGQARGGTGMPGKWLDSALHTRNKPAGTQGTHAIPAAMRMASPLPLLPVTVEPGSRGGETQEAPEKPEGRLVFYWGCGEAVRPGQPRVLDFSKAAPEEFGKFMTGRHAPDRGAKAEPGRSVWPNKTSTLRVPKAASLLGEHAVGGEGVPANWTFAVAPGFDFMEKVRLSAAGNPAASIPLRWQAVAGATGYFLTAMAHRRGADGANELILWSSSEAPDPGWGLMNYLAPARVDKLIAEKVVLPAKTLQCALPKAIFAGTEGAFANLIAYGPELNLAHPPRPADPKVDWKPEWTVRLRLKSTGMALLGEGAAAPGAAADAPAADERPAAGGSPATEVLKELGNPVNILKGVFGR